MILMLRIFRSYFALSLVFFFYASASSKNNRDVAEYKPITFVGFEVSSVKLDDVVEKIGVGKVVVISKEKQKVCYLGDNDTLITFVSFRDFETFGTLTSVELEYIKPKEAYPDCVKSKKFGKKVSFSNGIGLNSSEKDIAKILTIKGEEDGVPYYREFFEKNDTLLMSADLKNGKVIKIKLSREQWDY